MYLVGDYLKYINVLPVKFYLNFFQSLTFQEVYDSLKVIPKNRRTWLQDITFCFLKHNYKILLIEVRKV